MFVAIPAEDKGDEAAQKYGQWSVLAILHVLTTWSCLLIPAGAGSNQNQYKYCLVSDF